MMQKQSFCLYLLLWSTCLVQAVDDHFVSTTGNAIIKSKGNDVTILADTTGSTGKVNLQAGTTTPGTTTPGDIGLSADKELILKSTTKIMLDAITRETVTSKIYRSDVSSASLMGFINIGSSVDGDLVVVDADLRVNGNLTVDGDLIVRGGSVTIDNSITLTVTGNIIFDGLQAAGKTVAISGNIVGATTSDHGCQKLTIRNYKPEANVTPVEISGIIVANHDLLITNNEAFSGTTHTGATISGNVSAYGTIICSHNAGATTHGVSVTGNIESYHGDIIFVKNAGEGAGHGVLCSANTVTAHQDIIFKSNSAAGTGSGVSIASACTATADRDIRYVDNTGNSAVNIQNSSTVVSTGRNVYFKGNVGSGANVSVGASTTVTAGNEIIFDESTTISSTGVVKSGTMNGHVVFNGGLTVSTTTTFEDNATVNGGTAAIDENLTCDSLHVEGTLTVAGSKVLRVQGDLTVYGTVVINSSARLHVDNDIVFDGRRKADNSVVNYMDCQGNIHGSTTADPGAKSITVKNYYNTSILVCASWFRGTSNVTVLHDLVVENNTATSSAGDCACFTGTGKITSLAGAIIIRKNTAGNFSGSAFSQNMEADKIIFKENSSSGASAGARGVTSIGGGCTLIGRSEIRVERNVATGGGNAGAAFSTATFTTTDYFRHYFNTTGGKSIIGPVALNGYYGSVVTSERNVNDF